MKELNLGICTLLYYAVLKDKTARRIIQAMRKTGDGLRYPDNPHFDHQVFTCDTFADRGVILTVSRHDNSPWGLYVHINPAFLFGAGQYRPNKKSCDKLFETGNAVLKSMNSPCKLEDMTLSRITLAAELVLEQSWMAGQYLSIIRQGIRRL